VRNTIPICQRAPAERTIREAEPVDVADYRVVDVDVGKGVGEAAGTAGRVVVAV